LVWYSVSKSGSILVFDAQHGFGHVAARAAVLEAAEVALELGVFALRHAGHIGRVGTYAELAAERGLVFLSLTNVGDHAPLVASDGGTQARFGTNPVTMGFPPTQRNAAVALTFSSGALLGFEPPFLEDDAGQPIRGQASVSAHSSVD
jgi:uncharacterized oxidoreductase